MAQGAAGPHPAAPRRRRRFGARQATLTGLALPSVILLVLINLYPVVYAGQQSFRNGDLIDAGDLVGFANYISVLGDQQFWRSALFTLIFTVVGVFGSWLVGMALALFLRTRIPGRAMFKVVLLLPWIVPIVVSATSWNFLVATPQSPIPIILGGLGIHGVYFLANPVLAQVTVCVFKVWVSFPFMMMMMSSALASVDVNVYEAAKMDGASRWQTLTRITLPMTARSTYISWILMTIFCVNDFPTIYLLTGGGPLDATSSLVVLAFRTVFLDFETGPGVAIAFLMTAVLVVVSVFLYRSVRKAAIE
jgi:multiple sugar transport system permease protein